MFYLVDDCWLGTERGLKHLLEVERKLTAESGMFNQFGDDTGEDQDDPYTLHDNGVAVVSIEGSLVNRESPFNAMFGLTSYSQIRNSIAAAAMDSSVSSIVMDINSPGGVAQSIDELSDFISAVDAQVPVYAYSSGQMSSAAYWLGSSARKIYVSPMASVGSIGVISMVEDETEALRQEGIKVHVIRSGKYKAIGNPYEELTPEARGLLQERSDGLYDLFTSAVADNRKVSKAHVLEHMADGLTFLGQAAVERKLADGVLSFDKVLSMVAKSHMKKAASLGDRRQFQSLHSAEDHNMKRVLSERDVAALAVGVKPEQLPEASVPSKDIEKVDASPGKDVELIDAGTGEEGSTKTEPKVSVADVAAVSQSLVDYLKEQATTLSDKNRELTMELSQTQQKLTAMEVPFTQLCTVVRETVQKMQVAMGGQPSSLEHLSGETLMAEHNRVKQQFAATFTVGGVAKVQDTTVKPPPDLTQTARRQAVKISK